MKKIVSIICILLLSFSCSKRPINSKLDGRWQLMEIEWNDQVEWGPETVYPEFTYYDFQLELMQLARTGGDEYKTKSIWGRFVYTGDSLTVRTIGKQKEDVIVFGMTDTLEYFGIQKINRKELILNSKYAQLNFRKF